MTTVTRLIPKCSRCNTAFQVEIYLTQTRELLFQGQCAVCQRPVAVLLSFEDLERNFPIEGFTIKDRSDARQMGVVL